MSIYKILHPVSFPFEQEHLLQPPCLTADQLKKGKRHTRKTLLPIPLICSVGNGFLQPRLALTHTQLRVHCTPGSLAFTSHVWGLQVCTTTFNDNLSL